MKGKIDEFLPKIKQRLSLRFSVVDVVSTPNSDGAEGLAFKLAPKYDVVVSCGGDGTLHQVINGIMKCEAKCLLGILPFGTCNDVARTLGIPFEFDKAIDCLLRLNTTKFDLMFDGEEYISYALATGYLTKTSYLATNKEKKKFGRLAYVLKGLKYINKFDALPMTVTFDKERIHDKFVFMMLINSETAGGFKINKDNIVDNGKVKLVMIKKRNWFTTFFAFVKLFLFGINSVKKNKNVIIRDVKKIEIENHANSPFTIDGEKAKFLKKHIEVQTRLEVIKK